MPSFYDKSMASNVTRDVCVPVLNLQSGTSGDWRSSSIVLVSGFGDWIGSQRKAYAVGQVAAALMTTLPADTSSTSRQQPAGHIGEGTTHSADQEKNLPSDVPKAVAHQMWWA